ncbi:hypothetical protein An02g01150 [Aspergillus niger]|uniref:Uncharacterized protein n=2 Tax=Aspergillus niger TaxID=5061 RepID=A2QBT4_ASPNC|nr:hypothetical protein An02g01150 [Aspergillus niger]CAK96331.1 hypothetical protein An02g01150 [Aspergillus niger]
MASQCHWLDHTIELSFGMPPELLSLQGFLGTFYCESSNSGLTTGAGEASGRNAQELREEPGGEVRTAVSALRSHMSLTEAYDIHDSTSLPQHRGERLALRQELRKHDLGPFPMLGAWLYAIVVALGVIFPVVLMPGGLLSHFLDLVLNCPFPLPILHRELFPSLRLLPDEVCLVGCSTNEGESNAPVQ